MNIKLYTYLSSAVALVVLSSSCAHTARTKVDLPVDLPQSYTATLNADSVSTNMWWVSFHDKKLNALIEEALGENFSLQQARHRLEQADAIARKAGAAQFPQVSLLGNGARAKSYVQTPAGMAIQEGNQFGLNLAASYEIDLWGRVSASKRAAAIDAQTARDNLETAAISLTAQLADTWYRLASFNGRLVLLQAQIKNSEDQVRLLEMRFNTGQSTSLDVWQQREQMAALRTIQPRLEAAMITTSHQLALLLGRMPKENEDLNPNILIELPPLPKTGLPADLLENRPDVRAAMNRVRAADERVAVAVADRLPALRLTASAGYSSPDAADLFDDLLWNFVGNIFAPVLDGGRRKSEAERAEAVMKEQLAGFGSILLTAMREVEDALVNESKQQETIARQQEQHEAARQTLQHARFSYKRGLTEYLPVMTALNREQTLARLMVDARQQRLSYRIQLHRALGGVWTEHNLENYKTSERLQNND